MIHLLYLVTDGKKEIWTVKFTVYPSVSCCDFSVDEAVLSLSDLVHRSGMGCSNWPSRWVPGEQEWADTNRQAPPLVSGEDNCVGKAFMQNYWSLCISSTWTVFISISCVSQVSLVHATGHSVLHPPLVHPTRCTQLVIWCALVPHHQLSLPDSNECMTFSISL